jgi:hypothetical protein
MARLPPHVVVQRVIAHEFPLAGFDLLPRADLRGVTAPDYAAGALAATLVLIAFPNNQSITASPRWSPLQCQTAQRRKTKPASCCQSATYGLFVHKVAAQGFEPRTRGLWIMIRVGSLRRRSLVTKTRENAEFHAGFSGRLRKKVLKVGSVFGSVLGIVRPQDHLAQGNAGPAPRQSRRSRLLAS